MVGELEMKLFKLFRNLQSGGRMEKTHLRLLQFT